MTQGNNQAVMHSTQISLIAIGLAIICALMLPLTASAQETATAEPSGLAAATTLSSQSQKASVSLESKSGNFKTIGESRNVAFIFKKSSDYPYSPLRVKVKNKRVASATYTLKSSSIGILTVTPKNLGSTTVTFSLKGMKKPVTYTVNVVQRDAYVAVGKRAKLVKPIGAKNVTYKSKTTGRVAVAKTTGIMRGKSNGKAQIVATGKNGKSKVSYNYNVIVTDYMKLAKKTFSEIRDNVTNGDKIKVNYAYRGYSSKVIEGVKKLPVVYMDYSYVNSYGTWNRNRVMAYYDSSFELHYYSVYSPDDIYNKKHLDKKAIKKR